METIIDVVSKQNPIEIPQKLEESKGTAPGGGFNYHCGECHVGKIGKTNITNGRGIKSYSGNPVYYINDVPTIIHSLHNGVYTRISTINNDLTLSESYAVMVGGHIEKGKNLHEAYKEAFWESLKIKTINERIQTFIETYPDPNTEIYGYDFLRWNMVLTDVCLRGSIKYAEKNNIDLNKQYPIKFLIKFAEKAVNSQIIQKVIDKYGI